MNDLLNTIGHQHWELPLGKWRFSQEWNDVLFLHWQVELSDLEKLVPKDLEIDLHNGKPWVSIVAFTMEQLRPKNLPSIPSISKFHEINIRTYVKSNNKSGVYFLSIEAGSLLSSKLATVISELPYRYSKIQRAKNILSSSNLEYKDYLNIEFSVGKETKVKSALDKWLTERYALFQDTEKNINAFEIHHIEWPLYELDVKKLDYQYDRFDHLFNSTPHKFQYSTGVRVLAWGKQKYDKKKDVY